MGRKEEHNRYAWVVGPAAGENKMEEEKEKSGHSPNKFM
jgi:hypothetical protein